MKDITNIKLSIVCVTLVLITFIPTISSTVYYNNKNKLGVMLKMTEQGFTPLEVKCAIDPSSYNSDTTCNALSIKQIIQVSKNEIQ